MAQSRPTIIPENYSLTELTDDVQVFYRALYERTNEELFVRILARRSNEQRRQIVEHYKTIYGKNLINDIQTKLSGNFKEIVTTLMTPMNQYYCLELNKAVKNNFGTDEDILIELLCNMPRELIKSVKNTYQNFYKTPLFDDLEAATYGNFKNILMSLCRVSRFESSKVEDHLVKRDIIELDKAAVAKTYIIEVLSERSISELAKIIQEYESVTGYTIDETIRNRFSGDGQDNLLTIVKCLKNPVEFYADCLHKAMETLNHHRLIRIIVTRSEIDLENIKEAFSFKYGMFIETWIKKHTTGLYKLCLLAVIGCNYFMPSPLEPFVRINYY